MSSRGQGNSFGGVIARALMLIAAFLLFLSYASMVVNPSKGWYMTALGLLFVPIAILNVILLIWAINRRSRSFMIPLLALLPSMIFIGKYLQFSSGAVEPGPSKVKVLTYNAGHFLQGRKPEFKGEGGAAACMDSVICFVKESDADIVCLQEVNLPGEYDVTKFIREHFPEYNAGYFMFVTDNGTYGNVTLSRFPVIGKGRLKFDKSSNLAIYTDLKVGEESTLRVYNCHFESYNISLMKLAESWRRDSTMVQVTEEKVKRSIRLRSEQVDQVMEDIENCPVEALVAGDFNDNPMSYTYYRLMRDRKDTFVEAGKGFGATYSMLWPFVRIDYILYPKHMGAVSHRIPHKKYSDHYPVISEINL